MQRCSFADQLRALAERERQGAKVRRVLAKEGRGRNARQLLQDRVGAANAQLAQLHDELRNMQQEAQRVRPGVAVPAELVARFNAALETEKRQRLLLLALSRLQPADLGTVFMPYLGRCFTTAVLSEKFIRGGSTNHVPKHYQFELCPFHHAQQRESNHSAWALAEHLSKYVPHPIGHTQVALDATGRVAPSDAATSPPPPPPPPPPVPAPDPEPTPVGLWGRWSDASVTDGWASPQGRRAWGSEQGAAAERALWEGVRVMDMPAPEAGQCQDGTHRRTRVLLECDVTDGVAEPREDGMCRYFLRWRTPAACSERRARALEEVAARVTEAVAAAAVAAAPNV